MRIAFVSTILDYPWGGADALWTRTAAAAMRDGHTVLVAVNPAVAAHPRVHALQATGAILYERTGFTQQRGRRARWRQAWERLCRHPRSLAAAFDSFRPDFVFICQGGVFDFLLEDGLNLWLAEARCPFAFICQSNDERDQLSPGDQTAARRILALARRNCFVSTHNRDHAARQSGAPIPNATIVPNPIELPPAPLPLSWPETTLPHIAIVARLETDAKGLDLLLDACGKIPRQCEARFDLFGRGPDEAVLRTRITALGLDSRVSICGYEPEVWRIWAGHHCLLLPSRREGCALAMLEALVCGRPVIMTDVGGARDWIDPGVNGFICPPNDAVALAETLQLALAQFHRWPAMGVASTRIIQLRHHATPEIMVLNSIFPPPP